MNFQNAAHFMVIRRRPARTVPARFSWSRSTPTVPFARPSRRRRARRRPAFNSRLRHWLSDEDPARRLASERLAATVERLSRVGVQAEGRVGDADLMLAISDALRMFPADEIVFVGEHRSFAPRVVASAETLSGAA